MLSPPPTSYQVSVIIPLTYLNWKDRCARCGNFWVITLLSNLAGAILVGAMFRAAHLLRGVEQERAFEMIMDRLSYSEQGARGWIHAFFSGFLGNWSVTHDFFFRFLFLL